ncbi:MAG: tetratricopeptide repeat protein, partial [Planctomycetes bacterium]|nr:tetratricopeptide repeat protein [Planctomycetota bacterium]
MNTISIVSSSLLLLAAGCTTLDGGTVRIDAAGASYDTATTAGDDRGSEPTPPPAPEAPLPDNDGLDRSETPGDGHAVAQDPENWLDVWSDISFRHRFAESYLPDTQIEPEMQTAELEAMQPIMEAISNGKLDWAENLLQAQMGPKASPIFDFTFANVKFQREQLDAAAASYRTAIEKFSRFRRAWKNLAITYTKQSDYIAAARGFAKVIELGGTDAVTYGLLGYSYLEQSAFVAAESAYRMATLLDPMTMDWQLGLARSLF